MADGIIEGTANADLIDAAYLDQENEGVTNGNDVVFGDPGNDRILGLGGNDTLSGDADDDTLEGGSGDDTVFGGVGNDLLFGDEGADELNGGPGTDLVSYQGSNAGINVALFFGAPPGAGGHALGDELTDIENLAGSAFNDQLIGDSGTNALAGGAGDDNLFGEGGSDTLKGETGDDELSGGDGTDVLFGGEGNDLLDGNGGDDILRGGTGDDIYRVDGAGDLVDETGEGGTDTVQSTVGFNLTSLAILGGDFENLTLLGTADINGTGNALDNFLGGNSGANVLDGGAGNDVISGGAGADRMIGGLGDDFYVVDDPGDIADETGGGGYDAVNAFVSFVLGAGIEELTLDGGENGTGNALANLIAGNDDANILDGAAGADTLQGFAGNDVYVVDQAGDVVDETGGSGIDEIRSAVNFSLADGVHAKGLVENLTLLGAATNGTGNELANIMVGNASANLLDGAAGADTMRGLGGDDAYIVADAGDVVDETAPGSGGTDTVFASASFALGEGVENLTLTGVAAINGTGNGLANTIAGNAAANILTGGGGNDALTGGAGADSFAFNTAIKPKGSNVDTIADFSAADDTILLDNAIFAKLKTDGALKKKFFEVGRKADDDNDFIVYNKKSGVLSYDKDGEGGKKAIAFATLDGSPNDISKADFFVM